MFDGVHKLPSLRQHYLILPSTPMSSVTKNKFVFSETQFPCLCITKQVPPHSSWAVSLDCVLKREGKDNGCLRGEAARKKIKKVGVLCDFPGVEQILTAEERR